MSRPVNSTGLGWGAGVGVAMPLLGYLLLMTLHVQVSDLMLAALVAVPVALCALPFVIPRVRPLAPSLLIGALLGVTVLVVVLVGGISLIAWMLSD
jgi:hypothetical protein